MRHLMMGLACLAISCTAFAQAEPLIAEDVEVVTQVDLFGVEQQLAIGVIANAGRNAFTDVQVFAEIYDEDDEIIGEGIGFLVNQCGQSVPLAFALQPRSEQRFATTLELYSDETDFDRVEIVVQGQSTAPTATEAEELADGIRRINNREIAGLEWATQTETNDAGEPEIIGQTLLYGEGCYRDVFTTYDWYEYDPAADEAEAIQHPRYEEATDPEVLERLELTDPVLYNRSYLTFPPIEGGRLIHQTDINTLITAEPDGTFRRVIDAELFRSTLQGIYWLPEERFVAYYYGGYGDGVTYLAASSAAAYLSTPERFSVPSVTVPGASPDVSRFIVSGTFNDDETPGFYLKLPAVEQYERLFEWETLPGNNFPAPVYRLRGGPRTEDVIYFALTGADEDAFLYCYDRREADLFKLAPLPLNIGTEDRAYMQLSPDRTTIALAANGVNSGLWLLDLAEFDHCNDV